LKEVKMPLRRFFQFAPLFTLLFAMGCWPFLCGSQEVPCFTDDNCRRDYICTYRGSGNQGKCIPQVECESADDCSEAQNAPLCMRRVNEDTGKESNRCEAQVACKNDLDCGEQYACYWRDPTLERGRCEPRVPCGGELGEELCAPGEHCVTHPEDTDAGLEKEKRCEPRLECRDEDDCPRFGYDCRIFEGHPAGTCWPEASLELEADAGSGGEGLDGGVVSDSGLPPDSGPSTDGGQTTSPDGGGCTFDNAQYPLTLFFDEFNRGPPSLGASQTPGWSWGEGVSNCIEVDQRLQYEMNCGDLSTVTNGHDPHDCPETLDPTGQWRLRFEFNLAQGHRLRVLVNAYNIADPASDGAGVILDATATTPTVGFCDLVDFSCPDAPTDAANLPTGTHLFGEVLFSADTTAITVWDTAFDTGSTLFTDTRPSGILEMPIEDPIMHVLMDPGSAPNQVTWLDNLKFERIQ
jgi:hypothetical protein